jgi:hypothetical protein
MSDKVRGYLRNGAVLAAAACAVSSLANCMPQRRAEPPAQSGTASAGEGVLCVGDYVQSIWKGKNLGGPRCASHAAYAARLQDSEREAIERVCERVEIRTILSGKAATSFTREACARHAHNYEQATIARACGSASRTLRARDEDFNAIQSTACEGYLHQAQLSKAARETARRDAVLPAPRETFASVVDTVPGSVSAGVVDTVPGSASGSASAGVVDTVRASASAAAPNSVLARFFSKAGRKVPARVSHAVPAATPDAVPAAAPDAVPAATAGAVPAATPESPPGVVTDSARGSAPVSVSVRAPDGAPGDSPAGPSGGATASVPGEVPGAAAGAGAAAAPAAAAPAAAAPAAAAPAAAAPAAAGVAPIVPATAAASVPGTAADLAACEDSYIESIWRGQDLSAGSECAAYVGVDGYAPHYRLARIQNVCEGAAIRALKLGVALQPFTQEACAGALRARQSPEDLALARQAAASDKAPAPPDTSQRAGLSEQDIARTVDAQWRSIGRDCMHVAPSSRSAAAPANTQVTVTVTVAASGQVQDVSVRAGGRQQLESCIVNNVRRWRFPAASLDTVITIPLMFAGQ